ncbi:hypothetical protein CsSME_00028748 [Camellia sinensis var. sinensis]
MDPCPFIRIVIEGLAVKLPVALRPIFSGIHPSSSPCFCKIKLKNLVVHLPLIKFILFDLHPPIHYHATVQNYLGRVGEGCMYDRSFHICSFPLCPFQKCAHDVQSKF